MLIVPRDTAPNRETTLSLRELVRVGKPGQLKNGRGISLLDEKIDVPRREGRELTLPGRGGLSGPGGELR